MKLIQKSNRTQLKIILVLLPIAGVVLFFVLNYFIQDEIKEKLLVDELRVVQAIEADQSASGGPNLYPIIEVKEVSDTSREIKTFSQSYLFDPIENEEELFSVLHTVKRIHNTTYSIIIRHSLIETKDLLLAIGIAIGLFIALLIAAFYLINRRVAKKIWEPFYATIDDLKRFSVEKMEVFTFKETEIEEFNALNLSLNRMTEKISQDYLILKEFTENASHEIQTPLAIMMMHLDDALQADLPEEVAATIYKVYQSAKRLSNLNEKLILLTKIENRQFIEINPINLSALMEDKLEEFKPLIHEKNMASSIHKESDFIHSIDRNLAGILMDNLFSNAIKHNVENGFIEIRVNKNGISIKNATAEQVDEKQIFERFKKGNQSQHSIGLGLSIAKRIADVSNLKIEVVAEENQITFTLVQN